MQQRGKKGTAHILLLAALVVLLHAIIPHHHHLDSESDHVGATTSTSHAQGESSAEAQSHCHAFNNLSFHKAAPVTLPATVVIPHEFTTEGLQIHFYQRVLTTLFHQIEAAPPLSPLHKAALFRGPPSRIA